MNTEFRAHDTYSFVVVDRSNRSTFRALQSCSSQSRRSSANQTLPVYWSVVAFQWMLVDVKYTMGVKLNYFYAVRFNTSRNNLLTYEFVPRVNFEDFVVHRVVLVEVERLEGVEQKIAHVFIHVCFDDTPVEIVNYTTTVHNLWASPAIFYHVIYPLFFSQFLHLLPR